MNEKEKIAWKVAITNRKKCVLIFLQAYHVYTESAKSFMPTDDVCRGIFLTKGEPSFGGVPDGTLRLIILLLKVGSRG